MTREQVAAALARMNGVGGDGGEARGHRITPSPSLVVSSSLAASCSALVASFLGVAGTIAGAAIGSVVATTGTAVYGHALRKGGKRIVERLGPDTVVVSEAGSRTATWTQTEIALAPEADAEATAEAASPGLSPPPPKARYRKAITLSVAMLAVFGVAITVGLLAGGPIRQAGTGYNFTRAQPVARGSSATPTSGSTESPTATASTSASPSAPTSATSPSSTPAPSSASAAASQGAANQSPTG